MAYIIYSASISYECSNQSQISNEAKAKPTLVECDFAVGNYNCSTQEVLLALINSISQ